MIANTRSRIVLLLATGLLAMLLTGCWYPEKFDARLALESNGTYTLTFVGDLVLGALATDTGAMAPATAVTDLPTPPDQPASVTQLIVAARTQLPPALAGFTVVYRGRGRFALNGSLRGRLLGTHMFFGHPVNLLELRDDFDGTIEVNVVHHSEDLLNDLRRAGIRLDGRLTIDTDAKVLHHNASNASPTSDGRSVLTWQIPDLPRIPQARFARAPRPATLTAELNAEVDCAERLWLIARAIERQADENTGPAVFKKLEPGDLDAHGRLGHYLSERQMRRFANCTCAYETTGAYGYPGGFIRCAKHPHLFIRMDGFRLDDNVIRYFIGRF